MQDQDCTLKYQSSLMNLYGLNYLLTDLLTDY